MARCPKARVRSGRGALGERVTLAHELLHNFRALQDPVGHDMRYTAALQVQSALHRVAQASVVTCYLVPLLHGSTFER